MIVKEEDLTKRAKQYQSNFNELSGLIYENNERETRLNALAKKLEQDKLDYETGKLANMQLQKELEEAKALKNSIYTELFNKVQELKDREELLQNQEEYENSLANNGLSNGLVEADFTLREYEEDFTADCSPYDNSSNHQEGSNGMSF